MTASALLPVGKDCDCGHPLVWRGKHQWCAVFGTHPVPEPVTHWDRSAAHAGLVQAVMAADRVKDGRGLPRAFVVRTHGRIPTVAPLDKDAAA